MLLRIAIVLERNLNKGASANVAAILMGQAALLRSEIYDSESLFDQDHHCHAGIRFSTVLLKAGQGQILNLANTIREAYPNITSVMFTEVGQNLHNAYPEYKSIISQGRTESLKPVGICLVGDDDEIRSATKKFSVLTE